MQVITEDQLFWLRVAVTARVRFWQAVIALEQATLPEGGEWSDYANDRIVDYLDELADAHLAGAVVGEVHVTEDQVRRVLELMEK